jgi:hypothetical protein
VRRDARTYLWDIQAGQPPMRSSASSPGSMYRLMPLRKSCQLARLDPIGPNMLLDCAMHWPSFRHGWAWIWRRRPSERYRTGNTRIASSPWWLITFTAIRAVGIGVQRDVGFADVAAGQVGEMAAMFYLR